MVVVLVLLSSINRGMHISVAKKDFCCPSIDAELLPYRYSISTQRKHKWGKEKHRGIKKTQVSQRQQRTTIPTMYDVYHTPYTIHHTPYAISCIPCVSCNLEFSCIPWWTVGGGCASHISLLFGIENTRQITFRSYNISECIACHHYHQHNHYPNWMPCRWRIQRYQRHLYSRIWIFWSSSSQWLEKTNTVSLLW